MSERPTNPPTIWGRNAIHAILRAVALRTVIPRKVFTVYTPAGLALCSYILHDGDDGAVDLAISFRPSADHLANAFADHANGELTPPVPWEQLSDALFIVWITPTMIRYEVCVAKPSAIHDLLRLPQIAIDPAEIFRIFRNAARNAMKSRVVHQQEMERHSRFCEI